MQTVKRFVNSVTTPLWPTQLNFLALAHNSVPLAGSSVSPHDLVIGGNPRTMVEMLTWDVDKTKADATLEDFHRHLLEGVELAQSYHKERLEMLRQMSRDTQNLQSSFHKFQSGDDVIYVSRGAMGRTVHGVFTIASVDNEAGTIFTLSSGQRCSLSQLVPYHKADDPIPTPTFRSADTPSPSIQSMILVKRMDGFIDVGRVTSISPDIGTLSYSAYQFAGGKWEDANHLCSCNFADVLDTFKLTRSSQFRSKDRQKWRRMGYDL
jgi:hypothetical protein